MDTNNKIYVAGHKSLVGSAICRALQEKGYRNIIYRTRAELDLMDTGAVDSFFERERSDYVFFGAAKVGGIYANNTYPRVYPGKPCPSNKRYSRELCERRQEASLSWQLMHLSETCATAHERRIPARREA